MHININKECPITKATFADNSAGKCNFYCALEKSEIHSPKNK